MVSVRIKYHTGLKVYISKKKKKKPGESNFNLYVKEEGFFLEVERELPEILPHRYMSPKAKLS